MTLHIGTDSRLISGYESGHEAQVYIVIELSSGKEQLPRRNELTVKNIRLRLPVRQFRQGKRGQTASASVSAFNVLLRVKRLVS